MLDERKFLALVFDLLERRQPFAVATVVGVEGSASGRLGDKAVYDDNGRRLWGWVGGGCVERLAGETAREVLQTGRPRTFQVNLDGEELLFSVPCGGEMTILVEPHTPPPTLLIQGFGRIVEFLVEMATRLQFRVVLVTPEEERERFPAVDEVLTEEVSFERLSPVPEFVILASHHPDEQQRALEALQQGAAYVAVVASKKRANLIREYLRGEGLDDTALQRFHAPAGIDLKARTPEEIALSILAEVVMNRNRGED
jgi:xanthine dehydrogenase accessory factor